VVIHSEVNAYKVERMIETERKKGRNALIVGLAVFGVDVILHLVDVILRGTASNTLGLLSFVAQFIVVSFALKVCYHWSRAKGYNGIHTLWGLLSLVGVYILYRMPDRCDGQKYH
jgi:hypothetical protein